MKPPRMLSTASMLLIILLLCACLAACGGQPEPGPAPTQPTDKPANEQPKEEPDLNTPAPIATITMADGGRIRVELDYQTAPNTVKNFIYLSNSGFYDGVIFHRVIPGFMVQGGDPDGTGRGGPGYRIRGEFTNNSHQNDIKHTRGVISMARQGNPYMPASAYNTAGSQFFIMHADYPSLDKDYAAFGHVIEGIEVVDAIASAATDQDDRPLSDQKIASIRVDTFGIDYGEPERIYD